MKVTRFVWLAVLLLVVALVVACGSSKPDRVTVKREAQLYVLEYDADGDPLMRELGRLPQGTVCNYKGISEGAGEVWVSVAGCTLEGTNYGDGLVGPEQLEETEQLYDLLGK